MQYKMYALVTSVSLEILYAHVAHIVDLFTLCFPFKPDYRSIVVRVSKNISHQIIVGIYYVNKVLRI